MSFYTPCVQTRTWHFARRKMPSAWSRPLMQIYTFKQGDTKNDIQTEIYCKEAQHLRLGCGDGERALPSFSHLSVPPNMQIKRHWKQTCPINWCSFLVRGFVDRHDAGANNRSLWSSGPGSSQGLWRGRTWGICSGYWCARIPKQPLSALSSRNQSPQYQHQWARGTGPSTLHSDACWQSRTGLA